ncbi:MAG: ATP-binding domain-containing protein, partial [Epsilonproteobacteria bacterium]|nr:ATP-binding domain-containing protein [Campylobacterota bacterium]
DEFGFIKSFKGELDEAERVANVFEFYGYYRDYIKENPMSDLTEFLSELALSSDQDEMGDEKIYLMSIHASKGLEFDHVFIIGFEEGFFPIIGDNIDIEEERRLGYVAFTRAKDYLTVSYVKSRLFRGKRTELIKSQFLKESGLIQGGLSISKKSNFKAGDIVKHKLFGMGRVLSVTNSGQDFKLKIDFGGTRREILSTFVEKI